MIKWTVACWFLLSSYAFAFQAPTHPDPEVTTGDYCTPQSSDFAGYRYEEKIPTCYRAVSRNRKKNVYEQYGVPERCRQDYTIDHFIPLSMGGSNQIANLWPEHRSVKATRQNMEQELYNQLAAGRITRNQAVEALMIEKMNPPKVNPPRCR